MKLKYLEDVEDDHVVKFKTRITALCWHPRYPYTYAAGSKHGDIVVGSVDRKFNGATGSADWVQRTVSEIEGVSWPKVYKCVLISNY